MEDPILELPGVAGKKGETLISTGIGKVKDLVGMSKYNIKIPKNYQKDVNSYLD